MAHEFRSRLLNSFVWLIRRKSHHGSKERLMFNALRRSRLIAKARKAARAKIWRKAIEFYREAVTLGPPRARDWLQLGHALKHSDDPLGAEEAYRRAITIEPHWSESYKQLGYLLWDRGDDVEAVKLFSQSAGLGDMDSALRRIMSEVGMDAHHQELAIYSGLRAVPSFEPHSTRALGLSARISRSAARKAAREGRWPEAIKRYSELVRQVPNDRGAWVQLGHCQKHADDLAAAEVAYRRAIALAPEDGDSLRHLGFLLRDMGRRDAARAIFQLAREALHDAPDVHAALDDLGHSRTIDGRQSAVLAADRFAVAAHNAADPVSAPPLVAAPAHLSPVTRAELNAVVSAILAARKRAG